MWPPLYLSFTIVCEHPLVVVVQIVAKWLILLVCATATDAEGSVVAPQGRDVRVIGVCPWHAWNQGQIVEVLILHGDGNGYLSHVGG